MRASHSGLVHLPSKQDFVGSNPIARSDETTPFIVVLDPRGSNKIIKYRKLENS